MANNRNGGKTISAAAARDGGGRRRHHRQAGVASGRWRGESIEMAAIEAAKWRRGSVMCCVISVDVYVKAGVAMVRNGERKCIMRERHVIIGVLI